MVETMRPWWVIEDNPWPEEGYFQSDPGEVVRLTFNTLQDMHLVPKGSAAVNAVGLTVVFAIGTGYMAAVRGYHQLETALKTHDSHGEEMARVTMARGALEAIGGLEFTPYRILGLFHQSAGSTLEKVSTWMARCGLVIFSGVYALLSAPSWMVLGQKRRFWKKAGSDLMSPAYCISYIGIQDKDLQEAYLKVFAKKVVDVVPRFDPRMKPDLIARIDAYVKKEMKDLFSEGEMDVVKRRMADFLLTKMDKRERKLARVIGSQSVTELRMHDLLGSEFNETLMGSLKTMIEKGAKSETRKHMMVILACLVGIIVFAASDLSLGSLPSGMMSGLIGGAGLIMLIRLLYKTRSNIPWKSLAVMVTIAAIFAAMMAVFLIRGGLITAVCDGLMALTSLSMFFVDAYYLKEAMKTAKVDANKRMALLAISALSVLFGIAGMAVAGSVEAFVMAGIATGFWVVSGGISYYLWKKAQERQEEMLQKDIRPNIAPQFAALV